jgi:putative ABC transport system ATP-binding protein
LKGELKIELLRFEIRYHLGQRSRSIAAASSLDGGEVLLVKGPSGSGKSTLLRILARLQPCDGGQVYFRNAGWHSFSPPAWRRHVHYVAQKPAIFSGTVLENLKRPCALKGVKADFQPGAAQKGMESLLLSQEMLEQEARTLSGGEAARMALLRSVLLNPAVLLLDEPVAALDDRSRRAVYAYLSEWLAGAPERGIVLVSHEGDLSTFLRVKQLEIGLEGEVAR